MFVKAPVSELAQISPTPQLTSRAWPAGRYLFNLFQLITILCAISCAKSERVLQTSSSVCGAVSRPKDDLRTREGLYHTSLPHNEDFAMDRINQDE